VNFTSNKVEAKFVVPLVLAGIPVDARLVGNEIYASTPNFTSTVGRQWVAMKDNFPPLYNYSLELVKPDIALNQRVSFGHCYEERLLRHP